MNKVVKRKLIVSILFLMVFVLGGWYFLKDVDFSTEILSQKIDVLQTGKINTLKFKAEEDGAYLLKVDFKTTSNGAKKDELFSLPLVLKIDLMENSTGLVFSDTVSINGISGQNSDKSFYREIQKFVLQKGEYMLEVTPLKSETRLKLFNPKITMQKIKLTK